MLSRLAAYRSSTLIHGGRRDLAPMCCFLNICRTLSPWMPLKTADSSRRVRVVSLPFHCPPHIEHTVANGSQGDVSSQRWALAFSFIKRSCVCVETNHKQDYRIQTFISDKVGLLGWDIHMNDDVNEEVFLLSLALSLLLLVFLLWHSSWGSWGFLKVF